MPTSHSADDVKRLPSETDHERLAGMSEAEITAAAVSDPDNPPLSDAFFDQAKRVRLEDFLPAPKEKVCLRLDRDVLAWFRARRKRGYQTAINAALRAFIAAQDASPKRP